MPKRIQRQRTKGWRMPEGAVYVGRPTKWGNPFTAFLAGDARLAVEYFRAFCVGEMPNTNNANVLRAYREAEARLYGNTTASLTRGELAAVFLRGKDLACWCPLEDKDGTRVTCHADVLLELANA